MNFFKVIYWALIVPAIDRFSRNPKCWFGHAWEEERRNVRKCTKCGESQLVMYAYFDDEDE